jgi:hypothetical protein
MKKANRGIALLVFLLASYMVSPAQSQRSDDGPCSPSFPLKDGWRGADAAYSIPLPDGRDVWIFGDTLYGNERVVIGDEPRMVHNSIGISTCKNGQWNLQYTVKDGENATPRSFFESTLHPNTWYWALDGVYYNKELWVTLLCVRSAPKSVAAFGFETCGTDLARISNLEADPQHWAVSYSLLVPDGKHANPSASAVIFGKYLYIFTLKETGDRSIVLTRVPLKRLGAAATNLEYLSRDDHWKTGIDVDYAKPVMATGTSEMSVRYHPEIGKWVSVQFSSASFSDEIVLRFADRIEGPWTAGKTIYRVPEMNKTLKGYDPDTFCYAAKEHPELEARGHLLFTYVCNTLKPAKLVENTDIYFPKVVDLSDALK